MAQTLNSLDNRCSGYPNNFFLYNGTDKPILFEQYRGSTLTDGSWVAAGGESASELNKSATAFTGGSARYKAVVAPGASLMLDFKTFDEGRRGFRRKADPANYVALVYTVKLLEAGTGGNVYFTFNWDEVRT